MGGALEDEKIENAGDGVRGFEQVVLEVEAEAGGSEARDDVRETSTECDAAATERGA